MILLKFGTAGIRGKMGEGAGNFNIDTCYHLAYACYQYINEQKLIDRPVIIGFDTRINSLEFSHEIATVLSLCGLKVYLFSKPAPTPILAFLAKKMKVSLAFMVTASHNQKEDNGIKLFDHEGGQLEKKILVYLEELMLKAPLREKFYEGHKNKDISILEINFDDTKDYFENIYNNRYFLESDIDKDISLIYTPLHGVGKKYFLYACDMFGFNNINLVKEQSEPDGHFPTVLFPNPEEEGTLDLAQKLAINKKVDLVIANDPDADRFLAIVQTKDDYYKMSGNEIGVILAYFAILDAKKKAIPNIAVATTYVSSRMLKSMAHDMKINYFESLTGFGNIKEEALKLKKDRNFNLIFAYEEAIGFSSSACLLDKDGIGAALRFIEIAAFLKKQRSNIMEKLDELYFDHGLYRQRQWYKMFLGNSPKEDMRSFMTYLQTSDINIGDLKKVPYGQGSMDMMIFEGSNGFRLLIRPSGTENKIKFYMEKKRTIKNRNDVKKEKEILDKELLSYEKIIKEMIGGI